MHRHKGEEETRILLVVHLSLGAFDDVTSHSVSFTMQGLAAPFVQSHCQQGWPYLGETGSL
jgi:hypothetical protein